MVKVGYTCYIVLIMICYLVLGALRYAATHSHCQDIMHTVLAAACTSLLSFSSVAVTQSPSLKPVRSTLLSTTSASRVKAKLTKLHSLVCPGRLHNLHRCFQSIKPSLVTRLYAKFAQSCYTTVRTAVLTRSTEILVVNEARYLAIQAIEQEK